jgi:hypothetical protein
LKKAKAAAVTAGTASTVAKAVAAAKTEMSANAANQVKFCTVCNTGTHNTDTCWNKKNGKKRPHRSGDKKDSHKDKKTKTNFAYCLKNGHEEAFCRLKEAADKRKLTGTTSAGKGSD